MSPGPRLIRRLLAGFAWIVVAQLTLTFGIESVFMGLESLGLRLPPAGLTAVSAASTVLLLVTLISVGVLGYRGRLPGTGSGKTPEPSPRHPAGSAPLSAWTDRPATMTSSTIEYFITSSFR